MNEDVADELLPTCCQHVAQSRCLESTLEQTINNKQEHILLFSCTHNSV